MADAGGTLQRLAAFTTLPDGGNPAGVWIGETLPSVEEMQRIAAEVGYSETAFIAPGHGRQRNIRYYSPEAEVPFCGHATIATGVALGMAEGEGLFTLSSTVGDIPVQIHNREGVVTASLTSVKPSQTIPHPSLLTASLNHLNWSENELDSIIAPVIAYAGAKHLVLSVKHKARLENLNYDFDALKSLMLEYELTTLQLIWRESNTTFHSRNPFPVGGVVEDPATGAAAAALGGYLRDAGIIETPIEILIHQGVFMGRPSLIRVTIPENGGIVISGTAVVINL